jgi:hypothetical protein
MANHLTFKRLLDSAPASVPLFGLYPWTGVCPFPACTGGRGCVLCRVDGRQRRFSVVVPRRRLPFDWGRTKYG